MHIRTLAVTATAVALAAVLTPSGPTEDTAAAAPSALKGDFNGDGYGDLAVTAPGEQLKDTGDDHEGTATAVWGSASGFSSALTAAKGRAD
ncbi:hypothetical protein SBI_01484 [Streptomyces bingchenggensis BCW-1]|uniref:Integrin-like protein n=1 Tax=Streptomyces bingchenggensis (strain BCW-1) TaxID=749414 RepID=D7CDU0_STRBB|nr:MULTISPECIES: FG-GAP repeat protein [Streptomyces]ADI04605.1 hypothetical protein SBI_01484 [Streptomyces bingchenggensis BCW-1]